MLSPYARAPKFKRETNVSVVNTPYLSVAGRRVPVPAAVKTARNAL